MENLLYIKLYDYYRQLIEDGTLEAGTKIPSIRQCSQELELSRTTVETAYMLLASDGYIISKPQSGYFVCDVGALPEHTSQITENERADKPKIIYDFCSASADPESFNIAEWSRYVKSVLRKPERLLSYGEPQGEAELRREISVYASKQRGVVCSERQVVIGAGTQSLLNILCGIIERPEKAYFTGAYFERGAAVLEDHGIKTEKIDYGELDESVSAGLIYVSPSHMTKWGQVLPINGRRRLLRIAQSTDSLIIEDDYDSEFRYFSRRIQSLQGIDGGRNVVYIGTFSRLLLPSIRISFMVLPKRLMDSYLARSQSYNQTASKTEQLALRSYMRDGRLYAQLKKQRKLYFAKSARLCEEAERVFGSLAKTATGGAGYLVTLELDDKRSAVELADIAAVHGVAVTPLTSDGGRPKLMLCCSGLAAERFNEALQCLYNALY